MNISKTINGSNVVIKVGGRIDTLSAPEFERAVDSVQDFDELVIDFADVEYISSTGLRVILKAQKKANEADGKLIVTNLNALVKEIFDTVGFSEFINIR